MFVTCGIDGFGSGVPRRLWCGCSLGSLRTSFFPTPTFAHCYLLLPATRPYTTSIQSVLHTCTRPGYHGDNGYQASSVLCGHTYPHRPTTTAATVSLFYFILFFIPRDVCPYVSMMSPEMQMVLLAIFIRQMATLWACHLLSQSMLIHITATLPWLALPIPTIPIVQIR